MVNLEGKLKAIKATVNKTAQAGWFESATYPNGTKVAMVAAQNELGSPALNIPPRPFLAPTVAANKEEWINTVKELVKKGDKDAMEKIALLIEADIRKAIINVESPELSAATIKARKARGNNNTSPLNDTGYMLATLIGVTSENT